VIYLRLIGKKTIEDTDGAEKDGMFYFCKNPVGNVIVVLNE